MDKKKQIEEMVLAVYPWIMNVSNEERKDLMKHITCLPAIEKLYNAGWRKISENAVVLTNEEFWKLSNKFSKKELDEIVEFHKNKARKETAKKFAEMLKEKCEYNRKQYCCSATVGANDIDEIAKEFTEGKS